MKLLVAALFATALAAQTPSFPHQPHLQVGLGCQSCHSAAHDSASSQDNLLPTSEVCMVCHTGQGAPEMDTSWVASLEPEPRSYRFDHKFHVGLGNPAPLIASVIDAGTYHGDPGEARRFLETNDACSACHRGLEESLSVEPGVHLPKMGDCIVCHTRIDNPFTCPECHVEDAQLKPADHTREFIDAHATARANLDKISCLPCHGRNFACMGCH